MTRFTLLVLACASGPAVAAPPPPVTALAYQPDGKLLAAGTHGSVYLLDSDKGVVVTHLGGHTARVTAIAFSRDGKRMAVASGEPGKSGIIKLYAVAGGKFEFKGDLTGSKDVIYALDFAPDHKTLAAAGYDRVIRLWDCDTLKVSSELKDHSDTIYAVGFSPDGKLFASASADRAVKIWDPLTGKRLHTLSDSTDWVYALAWHPDGKKVAAAGVDKSVRVWEVSIENAKLLQSAFAHTEPVTKLAFAADGQFLYTASEGKTVKKWDAAKLTEKLVFPALADTPLSLAVRPDGKQVAVGRFDGVLQLIDATTGKVKREGLPEKPTPPVINKLSPNFAPRGQTTKILVDASNLGGDFSVTAAGTGVTVKPLEERQAVEISIANHVPPGPIPLTFKTLSGTSAPITFIVDRFPVTTDAAAIDSARQGRTVTLPTSIAGTLDRAGQADYFRFAAKAGQEVGAEILTAVLGSKLEPVLELADAEGRVLAESTNGLLAFTCPAAGTYAIGVHDKEYRGGADLTYRLHVGNVPVVSGVSPMGVRRGTDASVRLVGVNLGDATATVKIPSDAVVGSRVPVVLPAKGEKPMGEASVIVGEFAESTVEKGQGVIANPGTANGVIGKPGELHRVRFPAKKGERLIVEVNARLAGSPLDSVIEILDAKGKPVGRATLRATVRTVVMLRDHDSSAPGIRIETWNDLGMNDHLFVGNELLKIAQLPLNPDADCSFVSLNGQRLGFLDTTPGHHPLGAPLYKVDLHPFGTTFPPNGLPVFHLYYRNDDGGPGFGKDSRLFFDPPVDGEYTVRIGDARNEGGPDFGYRLTVRPPRPDFTVSVSPTAPSVWKGGALPITVTINRTDGFAGPVHVRLDGLPAGFTAPATFIEADQPTTTFALSATTGADNPPKALPAKVVATALIAGKEVTRETSLGVPKAVEPGDLVTTTAASEVTIRPGGEARLRVKIERRNGFAGRVPLEVKGLPHGVRVLDVGLNGILITERDTEREVAIYAEPWVAAMEHPFVVLSKREGKNTEHAAGSVLLRVAK